jgi:hypothetical protein
MKDKNLLRFLLPSFGGAGGGLFLLFLAFNAFAQTPQSFNYQAIIRDAQGTVLSNKPVQLRLSILKATATGAVEYSETQDKTTDQYGLVTLAVGTGSVVSGVFNQINWGANGSKFLKTELATNGNFGSVTILAVK